MFKNIYQSVLLRRKDASLKKREDDGERKKFKFNFKFDAKKLGGFLLKPSLHSQDKEKRSKKEDCFMKRPHSSYLSNNNNNANDSEISRDDFCELMDGNKDVVMAVKLPKSFNILDDNVDIQIELELLCQNTYNDETTNYGDENEDYEEDEDCGFTQLRKVDENKLETVYYGTIKVPPNTSFSKLSNMPLYFFDANEELVDDRIQSKKKKPQVVIKPTTSSSNCHNQSEIDVNEIEITYLNLTVKFIKKSNIKGLRMLPNFLEYRFLTNNEEEEREDEQEKYENEQKEIQKTTTTNKEKRTIIKTQIQTQQEENKSSTKSNEKNINVENSDDKDKNDCNDEEEEKEEEIATIYCSCSSNEEITKTMTTTKNTNINGLKINIPIENSYSHLNTGIREKEREVEMENIGDEEKRNTNKISENNEKNETKTTFSNSNQEWENENVKYSSIAKEVIEEIINTKLTSSSSSSLAIEKNTNKDELKAKNNVENSNNKKEQEEQLKSMQLEAYEAILRKRYGRNHNPNVKKDVDGCCCCDLKKLTYAVVESDVKSMIKDLLAESNNIKEAVIINNSINNAAFIDGKEEEVKESLDDEFVLLEEEEIKLLMQQQTKQQRKHEEVEGEENYDNKASSSNKNFVVKLIEDFIIKELKLNNKKLVTTTNLKENQSSKNNKLSKKEQEEDKTTGEDGKTAAYFCLNNANNQKIAEPKILKTSYIFGGQQKGCEERNERLPTISLKRSSPPRKSLQIKSQTQNKEQETLTNILKNSTHLLNNIYQELCMFDRMSTNNQSTIDIEVQEKLIKSKIPPYAHAYNELNLNSYFDASLPTNRQTKDET